MLMTRLLLLPKWPFPFSFRPVPCLFILVPWLWGCLFRYRNRHIWKTRSNISTTVNTEAPSQSPAVPPTSEMNWEICKRISKLAMIPLERKWIANVLKSFEYARKIKCQVLKCSSVSGFEYSDCPVWVLTMTYERFYEASSSFSNVISFI